VAISLICLTIGDATREQRMVELIAMHGNPAPIPFVLEAPYA
jgi:hypothetical protein